jgi:hypothetical protein
MENLERTFDNLAGLLQDLSFTTVRDWKRERLGAKAVGFFPVYAPLELAHLDDRRTNRRGRQAGAEAHYVNFQDEEAWYLPADAAIRWGWPGRRIPATRVAAYDTVTGLTEAFASPLLVYLTGREPAMRISTSLRALCCQSGLADM